MAARGLRLLKLSFLIGVLADGLVAINWILIASGAAIPNLMCGLEGEGEDYRFAMYISALFMAGWTSILTWGWLDPFERKGLLLITAVLLLVSIGAEIALYRPLLHGPAFVAGLALRAALIGKFSFSYFYSRQA